MDGTDPSQRGRKCDQAPQPLRLRERRTLRPRSDGVGRHTDVRHLRTAKRASRGRVQSESNTRKTASARRPPRGREGRSVLGAAPKHWCAGALPRTPPTVLRKGRVPRIHYFSTLPYLYTPVTYFIAARARLSTGNFNVATRSVGVWTAVKKRTQVTKERFAANDKRGFHVSKPTLEKDKRSRFTHATAH